ncbi:polysaccharide pyruvyl transferase family protein [Salinibacterium sp. UTAS2018]|uniref:polysaccharide pyruvyl transferase family protein n=1 Tax=Salinibacterium sp. UTAS2018 TaxID=2508880 RepID=UPI0010097A7A|nr:polysaccharide pyruvyl transferase family protein [Salinibacterium sp. UTAS2018]QAV69987.1 polysaccharide pyruvyl transferase family protein [Salinibacterium sp. UTAS2018]
MRKILIRSGKSPNVALGPEASLASSRFAVFGTNVGNLVFSNAVTRAISVPGVEAVSDSLLSERTNPTDEYVDRINNEFESFVVPLANAFRPEFVGPLRRLTRLIERLDIPVTVVGAGSQLDVTGNPFGEIETVNDASRDFVKAVLDKSASIGVRGDMTKKYLTGIGLPADSIDVIGCPSLYDAGPNLHISKKVERISAESLLAFNTPMAIAGADEFVRRHAELYPNLVFVPQSNKELEQMVWGAADNVRGAIPTHPDHPLYREDRVRFFLDPSTWAAYLGERDFTFGSRIHGNVVSLLGGTPAVVFAWDSRTLELAQHHKIPHLTMPELPQDLDIRRVYDDVDFADFNAAVPENFRNYVDFLNRNGIENIHQDGKSNPEYDAKISKVSFPAPVGTAYGEDGVTDLLSRLRWLRQGPGSEAGRRFGGYVPPIDPTKMLPAKEPTDLPAQVKGVQLAIARVEDRMAYLAEPFERRLLAGIKTRFRSLLRRVRRR